MCFRCHGTNHSPENCHFKMAECHKCYGKGHIARACKKPGAESTENITFNDHVVEEEEEEEDQESEVAYTLFTVNVGVEKVPSGEF